MFVCYGPSCDRLQVHENTIQAAPVHVLTNHAEEADTRLLFHAKQAAEVTKPVNQMMRMKTMKILMMMMHNAVINLQTEILGSSNVFNKNCKCMTIVIKRIHW